MARKFTNIRSDPIKRSSNILTRGRKTRKMARKMLEILIENRLEHQQHYKDGGKCHEQPTRHNEDVQRVASNFEISEDMLLALSG